jgi:hypothetical protein
MQDTEPSVQQLQLPPGCGDPIVEGDAHFIHPVEEVAESLAEMNNRKYGHYGMNATAET